MFCGTYESSLDEKGRLSIPEALKKKINKNVVLKLGEDDCIEIHQAAWIHGESSSIFDVKVQKVKGHKRITIPKPFRGRGSNSFYLGNKVLLKGRGNYLVIQPRPS